MTFPSGFSFQKAKTYRPERLGGRHLVYETKLDGHRVLLCKTEAGTVHLYSRGVSSVTGEHRDLLIADHKQPGGTIGNLDDFTYALDPLDAVEMEMCYPDHEATDVPTALSSDRRALRFVPFAWVLRRGVPLGTWDESRELLLDCFGQEDVARVWGYSGPEGSPYSLKDLGGYALEGNYEGFIVKDRNTNEWFKFKRERTMDVIVVDATDGLGKYSGMIGALVVAVRTENEDLADYEWSDEQGRIVMARIVAQVSGMTDDEREVMSAQRDDLPGRVCEIKYQAVGGKFRLRHPRFLRWRDDEKTAWECEGLEEPQLR